MFRTVVDQLSKEATEDAYADQEQEQIQAVAAAPVPPPAPAPAPEPAPEPAPTEQQAAASPEASYAYGEANLPAEEPVPPPPTEEPTQYTPEQEAWLAQPDPYRPAVDLLGTALGTKYNMPADINQAYLDAQRGYQEGTQNTALDKGTGWVQTAVDIANSGLGQQAIKLIRNTQPTIFEPRRVGAYARP